MEVIAVQIPASLYAALFQRYGDATSSMIATHLVDLLEGEALDKPRSHEIPSGYPRPRAGTITGRVWQIADEIQEKYGRVDRETVIKACIKAGINVNTASTQFSYWRKANP